MRVFWCVLVSEQDIVMSTSTDGGTTWSDLTRVVGNLAGNTTFRNPYPIVTNKVTLPWLSLQ